ncbi:MAG: serpin family protein, partial [Acetatifactor sp.]|nr:serpin family protein [Acetatifactor sp.]
NGEDSSEEEDIRDFSYKLTREALEHLDQENPILSPVSAYLALSMAAEGARGETAGELEKLLGENHRQLSEQCLQYFQGMQEIELELADSAWLDQSLQVEEQWLETVQESYKGEVYRVELSSQQTMTDINTWAEEHTRGLVKEFLDQPLPADARLCLLNALYLKADWQRSFEGYVTHEQTWYREDGEEKQVDTMRKLQEHFDYVADAGMDGVVLPFSGEELVFLAVRPQAGQTARELYGQLTPEQIARLLEGREGRLMNLFLPKFTAACDQELNELLQGLGEERAFSSALADFSSLCADEELYIRLVRQKAVMELNEEGVEAGAVTMVEMDRAAGINLEETLEMNLDHPFVYMILDLDTQIPLFVGIMDDPG